jgi:hypothetical protein
VSTVHKAKEHLFAATGAAAVAHQAAVTRHKAHLAKLKKERELREAEATAAIVEGSNG